jgi:hypothetical protein
MWYIESRRIVKKVTRKTPFMADKLVLPRLSTFSGILGGPGFRGDMFFSWLFFGRSLNLPMTESSLAIAG